jgi:hypothetical protein
MMASIFFIGAELWLRALLLAFPEGSPDRVNGMRRISCDHERNSSYAALALMVPVDLPIHAFSILGEKRMFGHLPMNGCWILLANSRAAAVAIWPVCPKQNGRANADS